MNKDLTTGSVAKTLLLFAGPMIAGNLLQQFYNIADCMVIGRFGGGYGLSAAGVAGLILAVLVNFFVGFSTGISFITARLFGAYEYSRLKRTVQSMIYLSVLLGILFMAVGIANAGRFLVWLGCPPEVLGEAKQYLCICFWGMIPQLLSNTGNAVLRSMGNTKSPLVYLAGSSVLNLILDVVLVVKASMGLSGAAAATVAAQWLMAVLKTEKATKERWWLQLGRSIAPVLL